jgi:lambda family phage portal protein
MMATPTTNWLDRAIGAVAPRVQLHRMRARIATTALLRHYEAASTGRRTQNWYRSPGDANSVNSRQYSLAKLRELARDLVRNNGQMSAALRTIANHTVGWGIMAKPQPAEKRVADIWKAWAGTTACDADGRDDLYGLQKLVMRGVAESGEMLVRRRVRLPSDGLPIPLQLQVLEPDFIDTFKTVALQNGGVIIQGIEFDAIGNRVAYWLYPQHPGAVMMQGVSSIFPASRRIPASEILHVYQRDRAGQVRAVSWFASIILPAKDIDEYCDAQLMKQKIAACLAVITSDIDGTAAPMGTADDTKTPAVDMLEPGAILNVPAGRTVEVVKPPSVGEYASYMTVEQRKVAKGIGVTYEDFTGDYSQVNFSSARMARLEHYDNVHDWRWRLLIPQFCDPAWGWAMQALRIMGVVGGQAPTARWSAPPMPMIEPDKEGLAIQRNVRTGIETLEDAIRERGYDPEEFFAEIAATNEKLDSLRIVLDSDPRKMTQAGQLQGAAAPPTTNPAREAHVDERLASLERESITTRAAVLAREPNHTTIHNQQPTTSVPVTTNVSPAPVTVIKESAPPPSKIARFGRVTKRDDKGRMLDFEIIEERKA